jgi:hypothetical protein
VRGWQEESELGAAGAIEDMLKLLPLICHRAISPIATLQVEYSCKLQGRRQECLVAKTKSFVVEGGCGGKPSGQS